MPSVNFLSNVLSNSTAFGDLAAGLGGTTEIDSVHGYHDSSIATLVFHYKDGGSGFDRTATAAYLGPDSFGAITVQ